MRVFSSFSLALALAGSLAIVAACSDTSSTGGFTVTVSGEDLAVNGYPFVEGASASDDPPPFVDGWAVEFTHVIVTVANVRLAEDPDQDPGDPSKLGATVASLPGPFAIDLHAGGPIVGKSGSADEKTIAIGAFAKKSDGSAFDRNARYAFSYDLVTATGSATLVNLDADGKALYADMIAKGQSMLLAGKATFRGPTPTDPVFVKMPPSVVFSLGLKNPASYVNCRNTDLQEVGGEFPRGIQAKPGATTIAQITIHTDHAFWSRLNVEGSELHFDPIAASASTYGAAQPTEGTVTIDDLAAVDVTGFKTRDGAPLPGRSLVQDYAAPAGPLRFSSNGTSFASANSYASYLAYSAAAGGHLNADGACVVRRTFTP